MSKLRGNKQFKEMSDRWLMKQGWRQGNVDYTLMDFKLEEVPYKPNTLIQKGKYKFWINYFDKEDHFFSKTDGWVTGFDFWKFLIMAEIERLTNIPTGVVIYSEEDKEFVFRPIRELPKAKIWRESNLSKMAINCLICSEKDNPVDLNIYRGKYKTYFCVHHLQKTNTKSIWKLDEFRKETSFQTSLL